jgi:hypothetical protein
MFSAWAETQQFAENLKLPIRQEKIVENLMEVKHKPAYGNDILISYEGLNIGALAINLATMEISLIKHASESIRYLSRGEFLIMDRTYLVNKSLIDGDLHKFSDPMYYDGNPPLWIYRLTWFI